MTGVQTCALPISKKGVVVILTKCDLATNEHILNQTELVKEEFKNYQNLELLEILPFSIFDEESIKKVKSTLFALPSVQKLDRGVFRYYVDRVFTLKGIGLVVTGTVLEGSVKVGDKIFICEKAKEGVVKNLQAHNTSCDSIGIKQRCAINLSNFSAHELEKGMLLTKKGYMRGFFECDIYFEAKESIPHNAKVTIHVGSKQLEATLLHYEGEVKIERGFSKVMFKEQMFLLYDQPFIISYNANIIGGGRVLNAVCDPIKKRDKISLLRFLHEKDFLNSFKILSNIHKKGFGLISSYQRFGLKHDEALEILKYDKDFFLDSQNLVVYPNESIAYLVDIIKHIYQKNQYALLSATTISLKYTWASQNLAQKALDELLKSGFVKLNNGLYLKSDIDESKINSKIEQLIYAKIADGGITPESPYNIYDGLDLERKSGDNALKKLTSAKKVIRLSHNLFVCFEKLNEAMSSLREIIKNDGFVDIKNAKKSLNISRKYLICYLEYLDNFKDIRKVDTRREFVK